MPVEPRGVKPPVSWHQRPQQACCSCHDFCFRWLARFEEDCRLKLQLPAITGAGCVSDGQHHPCITGLAHSDVFARPQSTWALALSPPRFSHVGWGRTLFGVQIADPRKDAMVPGGVTGNMARRKALAQPSYHGRKGKDACISLPTANHVRQEAALMLARYLLHKPGSEEQGEMITLTPSQYEHLVARLPSQNRSRQCNLRLDPCQS